MSRIASAPAERRTRLAAGRVGVTGSRALLCVIGFSYKRKYEYNMSKLLNNFTSSSSSEESAISEERALAAG